MKNEKIEELEKRITIIESDLDMSRELITYLSEAIGEISEAINITNNKIERRLHNIDLFILSGFVKIFDDIEDKANKEYLKSMIVNFRKCEESFGAFQDSNFVINSKESNNGN